MTSGLAYNRSLSWFSSITAAATLALIVIGGLVTSHGAGMAVPDWPNSYGYNMFLFPVSKWVGGILYEHTHRLVATFVGVLVVALTRWLGGNRSRLPLIIIGLAEIVGGVLILKFVPGLQGAGHFLSGIGGVVLVGGLVWFRNNPAAKPLPLLGWVAFGLVQIQGLLGGLRVVLVNDSIGIFHGALAQLFFVLLCVIALLTSGWWLRFGSQLRTAESNSILTRTALVAMSLIFGQLVLGATMRHQHAGLAIPDFPLAYGKLWPATDPASVQAYNAHRFEIESVKPITALQIELQMAHRMIAFVILVAVTICAVAARNSRFKATAYFWLGLVLAQALLGASTIWSNKAADVATAHVVVGALSLATGAMLTVILMPNLRLARRLEQAPVTDL